MRRGRFRFALLLVPACSLTHSLDDLRGGTLTMAAGAGGNAGQAAMAGSGGGGAVSGSEAGAPGSGQSGAGGEAPVDGPRLLSVGVPGHAGKQGFLEPLELQFSDLMQLTSLSGGALCQGSLQLRKKGDDLCVALSDGVAVAGKDGRYAFQPLGPLEVGADYELVVTTAAETEAGVPLSVDNQASFSAVYRHTIKLDGVNDFMPGETLPTSTAGYTAYLGWDADALYLGMNGAQIQKKEENAGLFLIAYLAWPGQPSGTSMAQAYKAVSPTLDFAATHYVRWKGDQSGSSVFTWTSDSKWQETPFGMVGGQANQRDQFVELRVPFPLAFSTKLPAQDDVTKLVLFLLNETSGSESTYAAAPSVTGGSTTSPMLPEHYELKLVDSLSFPKDYPVVP